MEALVILLGGSFILEVLFSFFSVVAYSVLGLLVAVLDCVFTLVRLLVVNWRPVRTVPSAEHPSQPRTARTNSSATHSSRIVHLVSLVTAVPFLIVLVVDVFFFEHVLRYTFERIHERTGISISADTIEGGVFTGNVELENLHVQRRGHPGSTFDLTIQRARVDIDISAFLARSLVVEEVLFDGIAGSYTCLDREKNSRSKRKKRYVIESLTVSDVNVLVEDRCIPEGEVTFPFTVSRFDSHDVRSDLLPFDVLFHSNGEVAVADGTVTVSNKRSPSGNKASLLVKGLPLEVVRFYLGRPLGILESGRIDMSIRASWGGALRDSPLLNTTWELSLKDVVAAVPDSFSTREKAVALPVVTFLNAVPGDPVFDLSFEISESAVLFEYSTVTDKLAEQVYEALQEWRARVSGVSKEQLLEEGRERVEQFKKAFPKLRFRRNDT